MRLVGTVSAAMRPCGVNWLVLGAGALPASLGLSERSANRSRYWQQIPRSVAQGSHRCVASSFSRHRPRQQASLLCHAQPTLYRGPAATAGRPASRLHRLRRTPCSGCGRTRRRRPTGSPGLPGARRERPSIKQAAGPGATLDAWYGCRLANVSAAATSRSGVPKAIVFCMVPEPFAGRRTRRADAWRRRYFAQARAIPHVWPSVSRALGTRPDLSVCCRCAQNVHAARDVLTRNGRARWRRAPQ